MSFPLRSSGPRGRAMRPLSAYYDSSRADPSRVVPDELSSSLFVPLSADLPRDRSPPKLILGPRRGNRPRGSLAHRWAPYDIGGGRTHFRRINTLFGSERKLRQEEAASRARKVPEPEAPLQSRKRKRDLNDLETAYHDPVSGEWPLNPDGERRYSAEESLQLPAGDVRRRLARRYLRAQREEQRQFTGRFCDVAGTATTSFLRLFFSAAALLARLRSRAQHTAAASAARAGVTVRVAVRCGTQELTSAKRRCVEAVFARQSPAERFARRIDLLRRLPPRLQQHPAVQRLPGWILHPAPPLEEQGRHQTCHRSPTEQLKEELQLYLEHTPSFLPPTPLTAKRLVRYAREERSHQRKARLREWTHEGLELELDAVPSVKISSCDDGEWPRPPLPEMEDGWPDPRHVRDPAYPEAAFPRRSSLPERSDGGNMPYRVRGTRQVIGDLIAQARLRRKPLADQDRQSTVRGEQSPPKRRRSDAENLGNGGGGKDIDECTPREKMGRTSGPTSPVKKTLETPAGATTEDLTLQSSLGRASDGIKRLGRSTFARISGYLPGGISSAPPDPARATSPSTKVTSKLPLRSSDEVGDRSAIKSGSKKSKRGKKISRRKSTAFEIQPTEDWVTTNETRRASATHAEIRVAGIQDDAGSPSISQQQQLFENRDDRRMEPSQARRESHGSREPDASTSKDAIVTKENGSKSLKMKKEKGNKPSRKDRKASITSQKRAPENDQQIPVENVDMMYGDIYLPFAAYMETEDLKTDDASHEQSEITDSMRISTRRSARVQDQRRRKENARNQKMRDKEATAARVQELREKMSTLEAPSEPVLPSLSRQQTRKLLSDMDAASSTPDAEMAKSVTNTVLNRHAFGTCVPRRVDNASGWLNDEIILAYLEHIVDYAKGLTKDNPRPKQPQGAVPRCATFNSQFWSNICKKGPASVQRWSNRIGLKGQLLLDAELVFIPINNGLHWTLLALYPRRRHARYFDSMGGRALDIEKTLRSYLDVHLKEHYHEDEWTFDIADSPRQDNGSDCGVFAITTARMLALGWDPKKTYNASDMPEQRQRILCELVNGGFHGDFQPKDALADVLTDLENASQRLKQLNEELSKEE